MLIRRYRPGDREAVRRLHDRALYEVGAHLGDGPWDDDLDNIPLEYLENGGEFLIGELEGPVVAMGALKHVSTGRAELKRMRVEPASQRRSLGREILSALEDRARDLGYAALTLETTVGQTGARRLYDSGGYREMGHGKVGPFETINYEKELGRIV